MITAELTIEEYSGSRYGERTTITLPVTGHAYDELESMVGQAAVSVEITLRNPAHSEATAKQVHAHGYLHGIRPI